MATVASNPAIGGTLISGTLDATGVSENAYFSGWFALTLAGTWTGTAVLQAAYDGTNFVTVSTDGTGTAASYTTNCRVAVFEPLRGVLYRVSFTRSSGTLTVDIRQTTDRVFGPGMGGVHM